MKETQFSVWIKLNKHFLNIKNDIFLCASYIPPEGSSFYRSCNNIDPFEILERDISYFQSKGLVLMAGDFNARTGHKLEPVQCNLKLDTDDEHIHKCISTVESVGRSYRSNLDKIVNKFGNNLLDICAKFELYILNGRTVGDLSGNYTCFQYNSRNTVDYFIASDKLIPNINIMKVNPPNHISDHAPVSVTLNLGGKLLQPHTDTKKLISGGSGHTPPKTYIWRSESDENFIKALDSDFIKQSIYLQPNVLCCE